MENIEIKATLRDRPGTERRLEAMGAKRMWCRTQEDTFFRVEDGWLKLREVPGREPELISYRRTTDDAGPRSSEYDVARVEDATAWKRLLSRVLPVDGRVVKERTLWVYESTRIHLDRVEDLGDFIELETVVHDLDASEARSETGRVIYALALDSSDFISVPYRDLLQRTPHS